MQLTNKSNLPAPVVNAVRRSMREYDAGGSNRTITQIIDSPRKVALERGREDEVVVDVVDQIAPLIGTALHKLAQLGADSAHIAEERIFINIDGWKISGQIDLQHIDEDGFMAYDYKYTGTVSLTNGEPKIEWVNQANAYAYLIEKTKGIPCKGLFVVAFLRDRNRARAENDPNYPQADAVLIPLPMWSFEDQENYVLERVRLHKEAFRRLTFGEELPLCTDEERWKRQDKWALMKEGRKSAVKLYSSSEEANEALKEKHYVEHRPGETIRCNNYCPVKDWCDQFKREVEEA